MGWREGSRSVGVGVSGVRGVGGGRVGLRRVGVLRLGCVGGGRIGLLSVLRWRTSGVIGLLLLLLGTSVHTVRVACDSLG